MVAEGKHGVRRKKGIGDVDLGRHDVLYNALQAKLKVKTPPKNVLWIGWDT